MPDFVYSGPNARRGKDSRRRNGRRQSPFPIKCNGVLRGLPAALIIAQVGIYFLHTLLPVWGWDQLTDDRLVSGFRLTWAALFGHASPP